MRRHDAKEAKTVPLWALIVPFLGVANLSLFFQHPVTWALTLGFFLFVPGYLILRRMHYTPESRWEAASYHLGISLLFLLSVGLVVNSLHYIGIDRPLSPIPIFVALDIGVIGALLLNRGGRVSFSLPPFRTSELMWVIGLTMLPVIAAGGAIRLNNGADNSWTMVLFALIGILFLVLLWRRKLQAFYPYFLLMAALAVLFSVSLRGWGITGHDIQREYYVFEMTMQHGFWDITAFRDTYNACLSITILPTMFAKMTAIADPYIFKVVFQIIFAFAILPIYFFIKRLGTTRQALMGSFLFITFPTFLNDMPMLNRQEISFVFFSLLMLMAFTNMPRKQKKFLTIFFLIGSILSHYSSSYIILGVIIGAWIIYFILSKIRQQKTDERLTFIFPTLNVTIIIVAFLSIFLWNSQITETTGGLRKTLDKTVGGLFDKAGAQAADVGYSLLGGTKADPKTLLQTHTQEETQGLVSVEPVKEQTVPLTPIGSILNPLINMKSLHTNLRGLAAKFFQLMLVLGCIVLFISYWRKPSQANKYLLALSAASLVLLIAQTLLPQLSVDYGTLRLFQQLLVILGLPIIIGILAVFRMLPWFKKHMYAWTGIVVVILFWHLSGFLPQLTGGYTPQLALQNGGFYYNAYYIDDAETKAAQWLDKNGDGTTAVAVDTYAKLRLAQTHLINAEVTSPYTPSERAYTYKDRVNKVQGVYLVNINSTLYYYRVERHAALENILYANDHSEVGKLVKK